MSDNSLDVLRDSPLGLVRTARKEHACIGANPVRYWRVRRTCEHGWTESTIRTESEVQENVEFRSARPCHGNKMPTTESWSVTAFNNPEFRPGCRLVIKPGDRYFEYTANVASWQSGDRYCEHCAVEAFVAAHGSTVSP